MGPADARASVAARARIRISHRNGWAAGREGLALGHRPLHDTIKVGFLNPDGSYSGDFTVVPRHMVEAA